MNFELRKVNFNKTTIDFNKMGVNIKTAFIFLVTIYLYKKKDIMKRIFTVLGALAISVGFSQTENCLNFNGNSQYCTAGDVNDMGTSDFTLEAWVFFDSSGVNQTVGQEIIAKGITAVGTPTYAGYGLRGFKNSLGADLDFSIVDASGDLSRVLYTGLSHNVWYHVAGVRKGNMTLLFVDGVLVGSAATCYVYNVDTDMPFSIGALDKAGLSTVNEFMYGKIDEVRVWNDARTNQEIIDNMPCAINTPTPNLAAVYNFDQTSGTTVLDASGNNINATLVNGTTWVSSPVALQCGPLKIDENILENVSALIIYPNPSSSIITLDIDDSENQTIQVYSISGQLITNHQATISDSKVEIDITNLSVGTYFITILNPETGLTRKGKFVKI